MKKNIKKNLISFVIGLILFGSLGAYALVTFNSKDVSYENEASGLSSNNVQGAIDELYTKCTKKTTTGEQILEKVDLEKDEYECRYFFKGANPNNYITFNNETWRILSVECDGTIKIVKNEIISDEYWDSSNSTNWAKPATLNIYLNGSYLTGILNQTAQGQIALKDFSIGAVTDNNNDLTSQINDENRNTWNGKVALITASEYLRTNSNQSSCGTLRQYNSNYSSCKNTTWMYINDVWWTLSSNSTYSHLIHSIYSEGYFGPSDPDYNKDAVRPSVYLSSEVQITGGDGSQSNPYVLN